MLSWLAWESCRCSGQVRQGKFVIELEGDLDDARRPHSRNLRANYSGNPVIENYTMTVVDDEAGA